jgi:hypothetical protein
MTLTDNPKEAIVEIQKAQNVLTAFYGVLMRVLATIPIKLPLYFSEWTPNEVEEPNKTMWRSPIWDPDRYSAFSHLPLLNSIHNFSTLPQKELFGTRVVPAKAARKGDAILSFKICLNEAFWDLSYDSAPEEWPTTLPLKEPYSEVLIFKITGDAGKSSLYDCWLDCDWPEKVGPTGEFSDTKRSGSKFWARTFDIAEFLSNPEALMEEIRSILA